MIYKHPVSVLVVIYARNTKRVLMLQRQDDEHFWQSVTGSLESAEPPEQAALREVQEETGFVYDPQIDLLTDCQTQISFEIFEQYRHRYEPGVTHNQEHWFTLGIECERTPCLTEHTAAQWLTWQQAAALTKSWSNRQAIERLFAE
ncbi:dihydroneopterin triphosphate diphosphatase [Rosenbergiella sp. S61]|uniref:Dihydroneopterin triphosphate diphosphatase n=1 Tax=Rosenbergiella gaditana TaxID=2726987 RepID=A0ABS5SVY3_9GAMM|nr:dihydroneopterin triphosphate diphosphatase [Rosenbergiella gaditana]MBT0722938.1 dihydroneopterin triphosphate diphosphatase [Rosenbergiella gaditana]